MATKANLIQDAWRGCRSAFGVLAIFSFGINVLILTSPIYMMQMYDRVLSSGRVETLVYLTLIAGIAVGVLGALEWLRGRVLARVSRWLGRRFAPDLVAASMTGNLWGLTGGAQPLRDLASVRSFVGSPAVNTLFDVPWAPFFVAVIWLMHPLLGILAVVAALILFGTAWLNEILSRTPLKEANKLGVAGMQRADVVVRNAEVFAAMGMLPGFLRGWQTREDEVHDLQIRAADFNAALVGFTKFFRIFIQIGVLGLGAYLVLDKQLTPGGMIAASILLGRALAPVEQAIGAWKSFTGARDAYDRLRRLLERLPAETDRTTLRPPQGHLACEGVVYMPRGRDQPVLNGVNFAIEAGEALGIIGPSAAGKSTLCKILVGTWQPTRGHARLDGADIYSWPPEHRGPYMGYLPQDVELFAGTVRDNIARLSPDPDSEAVIEAATAAGVHEMILRLPDGYETEIGEGGSHLSGGQRQRIGLARALYGRPRLIVLDEPNASLDSEGEEALIRAIQAAKGWGGTVVLVAHQARILRPVDKLLLLRDGRPEMFGPRDEVLQQLMRKQLVPPGGSPPAAAPSDGTPPAGTPPVGPTADGSGGPGTTSAAAAALGGAAPQGRPPV